MSSLWAVYARRDGNGFVVCRLRECGDGTYAPKVPRGAPDISPLPVSVHTQRPAARLAVARVLYDCAGTA